MAGRPIRGGATATEDDDRRRPYNPYGDRRIAYESLYNLPTSPEFLFQEEFLVHRRSFGDNLTFYTGTAYLAGASGGGTAGIYHGFRAAEPGDTLKLRLNRVLNASGQTGRRVGNRIGSIGLLYAGLEGGMSVARDEDDWMNAVAAGLGTGALFKAFSGPRSAAVAGALGGLVAGAAVAGKQVLKRYVPI